MVGSPYLIGKPGFGAGEFPVGIGRAVGRVISQKLAGVWVGSMEEHSG